MLSINNDFLETNKHPRNNLIKFFRGIMMLNIKKVKVIDSMMGTGKTSYAIQLMQEAPLNQKFIYVTPFLDEVQRIKSTVTNRTFKEPDVKHGKGKLDSLKNLIENGNDIVTTHALFAMADEDLMDLLRWEKYTLILDEVMEVLAILETIKKDDICTLKNDGLINIEDTHRVVWTGKEDYNARYNDVKHYALSGNLYEVNDTVFIWSLPVKLFKAFEQVYILTYLFDGQIQKYYYDLHGVQYDYYAVTNNGDRYELKPRVEVDEDRTQLKSLINIYDGKLNEIGDKDYTLSEKWFRLKSTERKILQKNLYNYFRNIIDGKSDEILWTTFKKYKEKLHGNGFKKTEPIKRTELTGKACFTSFNLRATNKYKHKNTLAFCLNRYMNPMIEHFFIQNGITVDQDLLALSDLLQWIFRSAIREGKPIDIYIPSKRMRTLLEKWLNNEI
jgi:hypothetical protein